MVCITHRRRRGGESRRRDDDGGGHWSSLELNRLSAPSQAQLAFLCLSKQQSVRLTNGPHTSWSHMSCPFKLQIRLSALPVQVPVIIMASSSPTPLLLGLLLGLLASARAASVSLPALPLSTASRWVVGADGRRVKLVCANWASHLEPVAAEGLSRRGVGDIAARVAAMGFNCVRLTWPTYLATNATLSSLPLRWSLERLGLRESAAGVRVNNPDLLDLPLIDVFREVVSALASNSIMVILDNQMTTPGWCCSRTDGNGFFGDKYFDPEEWLKGLSAMATMFRHTKNVVGMSLRNELRGPYQNVSLWYRYMQQGAEAVHAANPNVLVILSGLDFDNSLSFLSPKQVKLSFTGKLVFEQHWYGFSDGTDWENSNQNDACGEAVESIRTKGLFLLQQGWPLFFSEIGFDMSGTHIADNRYLTCFLSVAAEMDLDWAVWALEGSYYIREGILAYDETYGLLTWDWYTARNPSFIERINSLQSPFQGPGLPSSHKPYNVIFHPLTGLCVLVESANVLKLGPCDESNAWNYTSAYELVLKHTGQCLEAKSVGGTAKLGTGCSKSCSKWQLISDSGMHVSAELTKNGTRVCLDAGPDGVITTDQCKCLTEDPTCDPESQWFKVISSSRGIPGEASVLQLPSLEPWPPASSSSR